MKRAVFPGSFDPFTAGHQAIVQRGLSIFDEIIIAIGNNNEKYSTGSLENRLNILQELYKNEARISVKSYNGLTYEFCQSNEADFILRGIRNSRDFIYEQAIAQTNRQIGNIETIFLSAEPQFSHISSSIARDIARHGGDLSSFLPK